jgi:hypothetical protein
MKLIAKRNIDALKCLISAASTGVQLDVKFVEDPQGMPE